MLAAPPLLVTAPATTTLPTELTFKAPVLDPMKLIAIGLSPFSDVVEMAVNF